MGDLVVYVGWVDKAGHTVKRIRGGRVSALPPCRHLVDHSPDGFAWGYGGSGPAQLALALLYDAGAMSSLAIDLHQDFKRDIIARQPGRMPWVMTSEQILDWVEQWKAGVTPGSLVRPDQRRPSGREQPGE